MVGLGLVCLGEGWVDHCPKLYIIPMGVKCLRDLGKKDSTCFFVVIKWIGKHVNVKYVDCVKECVGGVGGGG